MAPNKLWLIKKKGKFLKKFQLINVNVEKFILKPTFSFILKF
jgi:hypothetical protein